MGAIENKHNNYKNLGRTMIERFAKRNMDATFCETAADALRVVRAMIPEGSTVSMGGSETIEDIGMQEMLMHGPWTHLDRHAGKTPEETTAIMREIAAADYYFMSTNAFTADGQLVNIDGNGNRVASLIHGPAHVIIVTGMNKFSLTLEEALDRARNVAAPANCVRLNRKTPCSQTGLCADCQSPDCICCQEVITRRSMQPGRIHIVMIGEDLGL